MGGGLGAKRPQLMSAYHRDCPCSMPRTSSANLHGAPYNGGSPHDLYSAVPQTAATCNLRVGMQDALPTLPCHVREGSRRSMQSDTKTQKRQDTGAVFLPPPLPHNGETRRDPTAERTCQKGRAVSSSWGSRTGLASLIVQGGRSDCRKVTLCQQRIPRTK